MKKWVVSEVDKQNALRISQQYSIPAISAVLLDIMHFESDEAMLEFLCDSSSFSDPFLIKDMYEAVERINIALDGFEKICVYGDYDADGVTSTAVLYSYLESCGANVMYYIPDRELDGYGLNKNAVDKLKSCGVELIITVDNGISAYPEVDYAASLGIDVVVTDHHTPPKVLPNAVANVDPHRSDDTSPYKYFSGVGVVFKLIMALESDNLDVDSLLDFYSELCAIGTIADVVSLTGENRMLVREGLKRINDSPSPGIEALINNLGCNKKHISSNDVAFRIAPRINACGRVGDPVKALKLFLTDRLDSADLLAVELMDDNSQRKKIEDEILSKAIEVVDTSPDIRFRKILVVDGEGWHQGVIGIVAARIKELYGKPTIIISCDGEEAKGSGRSVEGFALCDAITECSDLLTVFGGHPMAAGMSLPTSNIPLFRDRINEYAARLQNTFFPELHLSCKLNPATLSVKNVYELGFLEPFGTDNPNPLFGFYNVTLCEIYPLSGGKHLKLSVTKNNKFMNVLLFNTTVEQFPYIKGDSLNLAVTLEINEYNNEQELSVYVRDVCFADLDYEPLMKSKGLYEEFRLGKTVTAEMRSELSVTREDFVIVYKFLKQQRAFNYDVDILYVRINNPRLTVGRLLLILEAMNELGLITMYPTAFGLNIDVVENPAKVNVMSASVLSGLV